MFLNRKQLEKIGFRKLGQNVLISNKCSIYNAKEISIGDNSRVDDFCVLSGNIEIGKYVHIGCHSVLLGKEEIILKDFSGVSINCTVLSSSADFSGEYMTNPVIPDKFISVKSAPVIFGRHSILGAGSVVLPGVSFGEGATIGAQSLVKTSIKSFEIWGGNPLRFIKNRRRDLLKLGRQVKNENSINRGCFAS